jgi:hypothetical protein
MTRDVLRLKPADEKKAPVDVGAPETFEYVEDESESPSERMARLADKHPVPNVYRAPQPGTGAAVKRAAGIGVAPRLVPTSGMAADAPFPDTVHAMGFAAAYAGNPARPVQSRMVDATNGSRDLSGLDGAAQAGMVLNAVEGLGKLAVAVMLATCAPRTTECSCRMPCCCGERVNPAWRQAIDLISQAADEVISEQSKRQTKASYAMRSAIVVKIFTPRTQKTSFATIAADLKVDADTVSKHHRVILRWVRAVEAAAWNDADTVLRNVGIVGGLT